MFDLYCGLGGATEGFLAEGWQCIGIDNERHDYGTGGYPAQLWIQDILTVHGSQLRYADFIWASPPCQKYSYLAMPWSRSTSNISQSAKALRRDWETNGPDNRLFDACFRIQREACEAAGRYIPMVVENVRGAQPWVGRAAWNYGSFYLWGDVPAIMPFSRIVAKVPGLNWSGSDKPGYKAEAFNTTAEKRLREGLKYPAGCGPRLWKDREVLRLNDGESAIKGSGLGWFNDAKRKGDGAPTGRLSQSGSRSTARKMASAQIAKIPLPLSRHIARTYYPQVEAMA